MRTTNICLTCWLFVFTGCGRDEGPEGSAKPAVSNDTKHGADESVDQNETENVLSTAVVKVTELEETFTANNGYFTLNSSTFTLQIVSRFAGATIDVTSDGSTRKPDAAKGEYCVRRFRFAEDDAVQLVEEFGWMQDGELIEGQAKATAKLIQGTEEEYESGMPVLITVAAHGWSGPRYRDHVWDRRFKEKVLRVSSQGSDPEGWSMRRTIDALEKYKISKTELRSESEEIRFAVKVSAGDSSSGTPLLN